MPSTIKNAIKRGEVAAAQRSARARAKSARRRDRALVREALGAAAPAAEVPRTIDNARELDETVVLPGDTEVAGDEADDEFADVLSGERAPKVMLTTKRGPSGRIFRMIAELLAVVPNCHYYRRGDYRLRDIARWASERGFTHLLVLDERSKVATGLTVARLPAGPTLAFKMTSGTLSADIVGHGNATGHVPEVFLSGFATRLGRRVGRAFASLFPRDAEHEGRRVCTFHNQRDFIFFRQHRYVFEDDGKRVRLQELGPRFTLKLKYVLDGVAGERKDMPYEWLHKRHRMETSRRGFLL